MTKKITPPDRYTFRATNNGYVVAGTSRKNGVRYMNTKRHTRGSDAVVNAVDRHRSGRPWKTRMSDFELLYAGWSLPLQPEEAHDLTRTIFTSSAEEAAALYAALDDAERGCSFALDRFEMWVSVAPADEPDTKPRLYRVRCQMIPEYVCVRASEADLERYRELLAYGCGYDERTRLW